jgi:DNA polymerase III alpha subunit
MKINNLSEPSFSSQDLIREIYRGNIDKLVLASVNVDDIEYIKYVDFIRENSLDDWPLPAPFIERDVSKGDFDQSNQEKWFMPKEYAELDIVGYFYSLCRTQEEEDRVSQELELFVEHNMVDLLKFLKFLVDTMRSNNILWGVGRGSSVASYCLYLLGIHKIDSIKYKLDIREFLR